MLIVLECFSERIVERKLHDLEEETSKLADRVTAALVIYVEHMKDHHERLKLVSNKAWAKNQYNDTNGKNLPNHGKSLGRSGCTLAMFWNGTRFTERR